MAGLADELHLVLTSLTFVFLCLSLTMAHRMTSKPHSWLCLVTTGWGGNLVGNVLTLAIFYTSHRYPLPYWALLRAGMLISLLGQGLVVLGTIRLLLDIRQISIIPEVTPNETLILGREDDEEWPPPVHPAP